ncbi:MAG: hypothetical protein KDE14_00830 [Rhodobacteraceae bacterium]|nr:hypothetical protein [Paracoccaceae bacterium]
MTCRAAVLIAVLALMWGGDAAHAQESGVCRFARAGGDGVGGTGIGSDVLLRLVGAADTTDRGMGGTGVLQNTEQQRGLGGTGVVAQGEERGLGGTGIVGVVTGFASICVNGYEVEVDETTSVAVEGLPATPDDIKLGQVVEIEAYTANGKLAASTVNVRLAAAGPIESVASDKSSFTVAGQSIEVSAFGNSVAADALTVGQWVAVSGLRRPNDVVVGTSVLALPRPGREVLVAGPVRADANGNVRVGQLALANTAAQDGQALVVQGAVAGNTMAASTARVDQGPAFSPQVRDVSIQAYVESLTAGQVRLGTLTADIDTAAIAAAVRGAVAAQAIQAEGRVTGAGTVAADRVTVPAQPVDGSRPVAPERGQTAPAVPAAPESAAPAAPEPAPPPPEAPQRERANSNNPTADAPPPQERIDRLQQAPPRVREEIRQRLRDRAPTERPQRPEPVRPERPVRPDQPDRPVRPGT